MKKTKEDHGISVVKAGLSAIPFVGGSISSLVSDYVPTSSQKVIERSVEILRQKIACLIERIDVETLDKEEFSELFKSCYLVIIRSHKRKKLNAATSLIANILLKNDDPDKLSYTELDHYVRTIDSLSIGAIEVLGHIYDLSIQHALKHSEHQNISINPPKIGIIQIQDLLEKIDTFLLNGLISELTTQHLVKMSFLREKDIQYGEYKVLLTPLGLRFTKYVLNEN